MSKLVCAVFIDDDRALLVRRAAHRKWSPGQWDLVGGHVEKSEGLDVALVRECQEEVGLTPSAFHHVATLFEPDDDKRKSPFHVYAARTWTGGAAQLLGHEHSELGWFTRDEIDTLDLALEDYRQVLLDCLAEV